MMSEGANKTALNAILMLALTGARRSEVLELTWSAVDTDAHCLRLSSTKTVPQNRPLGVAAIQLLNNLDATNEWVFPATRTTFKPGGKGPFVGIQKVWSELRKRAQMQGLHLHGLRHFFASAAHDSGHSKFVVAGLLGHSVRGDTERYVSVVDQTLVNAADKVSRHIQDMWFNASQSQSDTDSDLPEGVQL